MIVSERIQKKFVSLKIKTRAAKFSFWQSIFIFNQKNYWNLNTVQPAENNLKEKKNEEMWCDSLYKLTMLCNASSGSVIYYFVQDSVVSPFFRIIVTFDFVLNLWASHLIEQEYSVHETNLNSFSFQQPFLI